MGKVSCSESHDPHKGDAIISGGTKLAGANETCLKCHSAQRGPFVFEHEALRENCTMCHNPHDYLTNRDGTWAGRNNFNAHVLYAKVQHSF